VLTQHGLVNVADAVLPVLGRPGQGSNSSTQQYRQRVSGPGMRSSPPK
jgi:hypothetical protein